MRHKIFVTILSIVFVCGEALAAGTWALRFDGFRIMTGTIDRVAAGGVVVSSWAAFGGPTVVVTRLNDAGETLWQETFSPPSSGGSSGQQVEASADGGAYVFAGLFRSEGGFALPAPWLARLDAQGGVIWQSRLRIAGGEGSVKEVVAAADGGCLVLGSGWFSNAPDNTFLWLTKIDAAGAVVWSEAIDTVDDDASNGLVEVQGGDVIVVGTSVRSKGTGAALVMRLTATGSIVWQRVLQGPGWVGALSVEVTAGGDVVVAGQSSNAAGHGGSGQNAAWLAKLSGAGSLLWTRSYPGELAIGDLAEHTDGSLALVGYLFVTGEQTDGAFVTTDALGAPTSGYRRGGVGLNTISGIAKSADGGWHLAASEELSGPSGALFVETTDALGRVGSDCVPQPFDLTVESRPIKARSGSAVVFPLVPLNSPDQVIAGDGGFPPTRVCSGP